MRTMRSNTGLLLTEPTTPRATSPHPTARRYALQRAFDLTVVAVAALPAAILGVGIAIAVKATSRGPVFFRQQRVGANEAPFECLKFRTMLDGDNPLVPSEDRITGVGAWLRRFSLDELPQLINVMRGEMSIVGPRPMTLGQFDRCDAHQKKRAQVKPGLTGLAQVSGRNSLPWAQRIELDLEYVATRGIRTDLGLVARTFGTVLTGHGVDGHDELDPFVIDLTTAQQAASVIELPGEVVIDLRDRIAANA